MPPTLGHGAVLLPHLGATDSYSTRTTAGAHLNGTEWTRFPIARLRYVKSRNEWSLYWRDRNLKFHLHDHVAPTPTIQVLLDEVTADPTGIFWGWSATIGPVRWPAQASLNTSVWEAGTVDRRRQLLKTERDLFGAPCRRGRAVRL